MGEEEIIIRQQQRRCLAAPLIFFVVVGFQFVSRYLDQLKKMGSKSATEIQLRAEIKQLLKEATSLSQPSTFAQAAKLRRLAAAKERELANYKEVHGKEMKLSSDSYPKILFISKVVTYFVLICWFWRTPITEISQQLVQPFGRFLSWRTGGHLNNVMGQQVCLSTYQVLRSVHQTYIFIRSKKKAIISSDFCWK